LFNVSVEAVPAPQVGPVEEPEDLAEFATAAAASAQQRATGGSGGSAGPREPATALRAKGIETESPQLTYSGPAEDGTAQVQGNGGAQTAAAGAGGSRRERREAARRQGRHAKPKSAKRR
jgi:preprotein translocase subunit SecA